MRPEKNKFKWSWKTMKNGLFLYTANENQMEFGLLKIKSELSGKKWDKAMKIYLLGMTEVIVVGEKAFVERVAIIQI
jgi:lysyl-tRNA synthetase class 2